MKFVYSNIFLWALIILVAACDRKNENLVMPLLGDAFPQIILLDDAGDGELEDEDSFSFVITLAERVDPSGKALDGKIVPLTADVTVHFEISDFEGFSNLSDYILGAEAFYEIDDCTTSADMGLDLDLIFDSATGKGSVTFPAGVEEIEIEFETDEDLFDDDVLNTESRGLEIRLTDVDADSQNVVANTANTFEYKVLDDEAIYGEYELDVTNAEQFKRYIRLFGLVNPEIAGLSVDDVEEIIVEFKYDEFSTVIVLKETMEEDDCGEIEIVNREIEIEGDYEELDDNALEGEVEFEGEVELENGIEEEFTYKGSFRIINGRLELTLQGEFDGEETEEITLILNK